MITGQLKPPAPVRELYDQNFQKVHRLADLKNEGRSALLCLGQLTVLFTLGVPLFEKGKLIRVFHAF